MIASGPGDGARGLVRVAVLVLLLALWISPVAQANDLVVGKMAPSITLITLDGKQMSTADLRGKVVIVTFWATWCEPCREELPLLSHYAKKHAKQGLVVRGFSLDPPSGIAKVRHVADTLNFPVGMLGDPHVHGYGRIWHLPVSFLIGRDDRLLDNGWKEKQQGWTSERLQQLVTPQLDRPA